MIRRRWAFTLIEVLIAMGLGVLLLLGLQRIVIHAYRAAQMVESEETANARASFPFSMLAADLAGLPAGAGFVLGGRSLTFRTLSALQSDSIAARHTVNVRYTWEPDGSDELALLRTEWELEAEPEDSVAVTIAQGLQRASIEIFDGQGWHGRWPLRTARAAGAVRLRLERGDTSGMRVMRLKPMRWRRHSD